MDLFLALRTLFTPGWWVDAREQGGSQMSHDLSSVVHPSGGLVFQQKTLPEGTTYADIGFTGPLADVELEP